MASYGCCGGLSQDFSSAVSMPTEAVIFIKNIVELLSGGIPWPRLAVVEEVHTSLERELCFWDPFAAPVASPVASRGIVWLLWEASGAVLDVTMGWVGTGKRWRTARRGFVIQSVHHRISWACP